MDRRWAYNPNFPKNFSQVKIAHAVLGCVAWVIFFPLGGMLVRLLNGPYAVRIHYIIQLFSYALFLTTAGTGIWMGRWTNQVDKTHPIIGLVMLAVSFLQILAGSIQHILFKKGFKTRPMGFIHIWVGRTLITVGMINGGLGLMLSADSNRAEKIAYGVVAGVMWMAFIFVVTVLRSVRSKVRPLPNMEQVTGIMDLDASSPTATRTQGNLHKGPEGRTPYVISHSARSTSSNSESL